MKTGEKIIHICQWCHDPLEKVPAPMNSFAEGMKEDNFCTPYCLNRYMAIKEGMDADKEQCRFCEKTIEYRKWTIRNASFCDGRCIDLYQELPTNKGYKAEYTKYLEAKEQFLKTQKRIKQMEDTIMQVKKKSPK